MTYNPQVGDKVISSEGDNGKIYSLRSREDYPYDWVLVKWDNYDELESFGVNDNPGDLVWVSEKQAWLENDD